MPLRVRALRRPGTRTVRRLPPSPMHPFGRAPPSASARAADCLLRARGSPARAAARRYIGKPIALMPLIHARFQPPSASAPSNAWNVIFAATQRIGSGGM